MDDDHDLGCAVIVAYLQGALIGLVAGLVSAFLLRF